MAHFSTGIKDSFVTSLFQLKDEPEGSEGLAKRGLLSFLRFKLC